MDLIEIYVEDDIMKGGLLYIKILRINQNLYK